MDIALSSFDKIEIAGGDTAQPLNAAKRLRIILRHLPSSNAKVLDCGCGAGEYVRLLRQEHSVDAVGLEYSEEKVAQARKDVRLAPFVTQGDIQSLCYADNTFDMVLLNEVIEHVPNDQLALKEAHRVLKPGGILIMFAPNRFFCFESHGVSLRGTQKKVPVFVPFVPYVPMAIGKLMFDYWARNYWPWELRQLAKANGFSLVDTAFLWQTFENISGQQPWFVRALKPLLRLIASTCEKIPLLRCFGLSQGLVLRAGKKHP